MIEQPNQVNQSKESVEAIQKPFDPNDRARMAVLSKKYDIVKEEPKTNEYMLGNKRVTIGSGGARVEELPSSRDPNITYTNVEKKEYKVEFLVSANDPDASGDFKGKNRDAKYVLQVDEDGKVMFSSRLDKAFDESKREYTYDGSGSYQIHEPEVALLLKTEAVSKALELIAKQKK